MSVTIVDETRQTLIQAHQLMKRNALKRAKTRPFSGLIHESEVVNQPRISEWLIHFLF
jgi:hypothetical protein